MNVQAYYEGFLSKLAENTTDPLMKGIQSLREAIDMHQTHMDDPQTATPKSQEEMMSIMKEALRQLQTHSESM